MLLSDVIKQSNDGYFSEIDYLRGLAIIAVIAIHLSAYFIFIKHMGALVIINIIVDIFSHFAVPLFIFISGFVLSIKYHGVFSKLTFYKRRMRSIIPQYLVFSFLFLIISAVYTKSIPSILTIIYDIIAGQSFYHLWFFVLIIQLYLLYPWIIKIYERYSDTGKAENFLALCLTVQILSSIIEILFSTLFHIIIINTLFSYTFIQYIFYFVLGIYVNRNSHSIRRFIGSVKPLKIGIPVIVLTVVISSVPIIGKIYYNDYYNAPTYYYLISVFLQPVLYIFIFALCYKITIRLMEAKNIMTNIIHSLGKYSFGIYLIHPLFMTATVFLMSWIGITYNDWIFYPVIFLLTITISYLGILIMSYVPYSELIIGIHNKSKHAR